MAEQLQTAIVEGHSQMASEAAYALSELVRLRTSPKRMGSMGNIKMEANPTTPQLSKPQISQLPQIPQIQTQQQFISNQQQLPTQQQQFNQQQNSPFDSTPRRSDRKRTRKATDDEEYTEGEDLRSSRSMMRRNSDKGSSSPSVERLSIVVRQKKKEMNVFFSTLFVLNFNFNSKPKYKQLQLPQIHLN